MVARLGDLHLVLLRLFLQAITKRLRLREHFRGHALLQSLELSTHFLQFFDCSAQLVLEHSLLFVTLGKRFDGDSFGSVGLLLLLTWAKELLCPADRQRLKRREKKTEPKEKIPALTAEQTQAVLRSTPHKYRIYTDGRCTGNGQKGVWGTAAFGVHVMEVISAADDWWAIENQVEPGEEGECEVCWAPVRYCVCSTDRAPAEVAPPPEDESEDRPAVARADL